MLISVGVGGGDGGGGGASGNSGGVAGPSVAGWRQRNSGVTVAASVTYSVLSGLFPKLVAMTVSDGDGDSGGCSCCACSRVKQSAVKSSSFYPPILERELFS